MVGGANAQDEIDKRTLKSRSFRNENSVVDFTEEEESADYTNSSFTSFSDVIKEETESNLSLTDKEEN